MRIALLVGFAALAGCRSRASASEHSPPQRAAVALPRVAAPPPAPPPLARVARIEDRAIIRVVPEGASPTLLELGASPRFERSQSPATSVLRPTPDGWMAVVRDGPSPRVQRYGSAGSATHTLAAGLRVAAALRDGTVFAVTDRGEWVHSDARHTEVLGAPSPRQVQDVAVAADGAVWGILDQTLHQRVHDRWEAVVSHQGVAWRAFVANADEPLTLVGAMRVMRYAANGWQEVELGRDIGRGVGPVAVGPDGTVVFVKADTQELVTVAPNGARATLDLLAHAIPPGVVRAVARDGRDRTWVASSSGLVVLGPDLAVLRWYAPERNAEGLEHVTDLLVTGRGPAELPPARPVPGQLRGRLLANGQPVAHARIELCEEPLEELGTGYTSPCDPLGRESSTPPRVGLSRADGTFEFADVPTADVVLKLAVRPPQHRWVNTAVLVDATELGDTPVNLGDVTVRLRR